MEPGVGVGGYDSLDAETESVRSPDRGLYFGELAVETLDQIPHSLLDVVTYGADDFDRLSR